MPVADESPQPAANQEKQANGTICRQRERVSVCMKANDMGPGTTPQERRGGDVVAECGVEHGFDHAFDSGTDRATAVGLVRVITLCFGEAALGVDSREPGVTCTGEPGRAEG
jgi:hypothetical protein